MRRRVTTGGATEATTKGDLVPVLELLHARQEQPGYLAEDYVAAVAATAGISPAELYGAITAYPRFRLEPQEDVPAVCTGPACLMQGAKNIRGALDAAETHCLGLCDQPVGVLTPQGARTARQSTPPQLRAPEALEATLGVPESAFFTTNTELYEKLVWYAQHPSRQSRELGLSLVNEFAINSPYPSDGGHLGQ